MSKRKGIPLVPSVILWWVTPAISFYLLETLTHSISETMEWTLIFLNLIFYYLVYGLIFILSKRSSVSLSLGTLFFMIVGMINYYVIEFRSVPVYPWDIFSLKTAVSVSENYDYSLEPETVKLILIFLLLIFAGLWTQWKLSVKKTSHHVLASAAAILLIVLYGSAVQSPEVHRAVGFYEYHFTPNSFYRKNGFAVSFLSNMQYLKIEEPEGYDAEKVEEILTPYIETDGDGQSEGADIQPNVIVIMNEAFSDPAVLGEFETNMDYMPFIHAMEKNTIKGTAVVSVKGGNTANSEYEFLTGNSMAFLPGGSIPYQQYIREDMPTLASQLKELGYRTCAMHPYGASGWNRNKVYEYFGFDESYFKPDFSNASILREYVTDLATYQKIVDIYHEKEEGEPLFVFDVTMQNHSSYSKEYDNFTPDVEVYGSDQDKLLERYLSLIKISDAAFGQLVEYFEDQEEPTVILMFGDHQPADWVVEPIYKMNGMSDSSEWSESMERYEVPFVLWANYDIDTEAITSRMGYENTEKGMLSINYLSTLLLETAGVALNPSQLYMRDLAVQFPIITANTVCDADGVTYDVTNADTLPEGLREYWMLNYNKLFDIKNRQDTWYE